MRRFTMSDTPGREPTPGRGRHYSRPPIDGSDEEIDAWAERFIDAVLGDVVEIGEVIQDHETPDVGGLQK
jgi:hypothetical protein